MKNKQTIFRVGIVILSLVGLLIFCNQASADSNIYRLYNPNTSEHFYTVGIDERNNLRNSGWNFESIGWVEADYSNTAVYRVYNPNSGLHFFTPSAYERDSLVNAGWRNEGIAFYTAGGMPVYRAYNPNNGQHNYTVSQYELSSLVSAGWRNEGITFMALTDSPYFQGKLDTGVGNMKYYVDSSVSWAAVPTAANDWMYTPWGNPIYLTQQGNNTGTSIDCYAGNLPDGVYARTLFYDGNNNSVMGANGAPVGNYRWSRINFSFNYYSDAVVRNGTVARHEMGHAFGLSHPVSPRGTEIMKPVSNETDNLGIDQVANDNVTIRY